MDIMSSFIYSFGVIAVVAIMLVVLTLPYIVFGMKLFIKQLVTKKNVGFVFIRNLADNYGLPHIIDLRTKEYKYKIGIKEHIYFIDREHFKGFKFLGIPTAFFDSDNMVTSVGIHFHKLNEKGEPIYNEDGTAVMSAEKPSHSLEPSLIKAIISSKALTQAIEELFNKHKTQIYILGAIAIGIGISVYLMYETKSTDLPMMMNSIEEIRAICAAATPERVILNA